MLHSAMSGPRPRASSNSPRSNGSHRESDDGYRDVVVILNSQWRVIACRDHIQWILQFATRRRGGVAWDSYRYLRTRIALIARCRQSVPEISPSALAILQALPERI